MLSKNNIGCSGVVHGATRNGAQTRRSTEPVATRLPAISSHVVAPTTADSARSPLIAELLDPAGATNRHRAAGCWLLAAGPSRGRTLYGARLRAQGVPPERAVRTGERTLQWPIPAGTPSWLSKRVKQTLLGRVPYATSQPLNHLGLGDFS